MADITPETIQQLAEKGDVDKSTILKRLAGIPVRGRAGVRADKAIEEAGLAPRSITMSDKAR